MRRDKIAKLAISIHAPRTGSDPMWCSSPSCIAEFQSTLPARGATVPPTQVRSPSSFQSTLPARGATPATEPCASANTFQSTLPARGATHRAPAGIPAAHFNPRSPHGERQERGVHHQRRDGISIHAPRTGSDQQPARDEGIHSISIHAPRTGSDGHAAGGCRRGGDFNPRSPHGERHAECPEDFDALPISIHAPRTGSDGSPERPDAGRSRISIHAPRTGSDFLETICKKRYIISIHAPRTGSDVHLQMHQAKEAFQSTLPARGATSTCY